MSTQATDILSPFDSPTFGKDGSFEVNKPVGSMSISPCGRDVVLASRHGLHIVDLDSPWSPPRHLSHHTPWEVADVQWSPFPWRAHWVVSTSNQKALVWNLEMSSRYSPIEIVIHGHSRALTDIQFSAHHPDMLATCAVDSFVHCWDLRQPERPAFSFCDWFAGATQTKWNRINSHIIASSHDRTLHIWDDRKGATPLRSLDAHDTKIYGIDWSRTDQNKIITCSLDKSIKFWDCSAEGNRPQRLLRTPFPVWRARHTPFGYGIMAMPQRGDFNVYLYDCREESVWDRDPDRAPQLVGKFEGHQDNVKEFLWRPRGESEDGSDNREFQLVTWGSDHFLRLHHLNDSLLERTGFERGRPGHRTTRRGALYRTFRVDDDDLPPIPHQLSPLAKSMYANKGIAMTSQSTVNSLGWADNGFLNVQQGTRAKAPERKDLDPITWMKGVKIGRRGDKGKQDTTVTSLPILHVESWDQFDNLGEEVSHVGQTFSKVEFNTVDINKRFVRMSLSGPWGRDKSQAFLTCRLDYPTDYPAAAVTVTLLETSSIGSEAASAMVNTTKTIAQAFAQQKKHSTEAVVHYLQGEKTLEDLIGLLKQGLETPDILPIADDGDSSSEDEDELALLGNGQLDELGLGGSDVLTSSNANANVPLPKACGAIWTNDGRLLCFFPPKVDKLSSITASYGADGPFGPTKRKSRFFDGFGRFHPLLEGRQSRASSLGTFENSPPSSDSEDDSSMSNSSESSEAEGALSDRPHTAVQSMMYTSLLAQSVSFNVNDGALGSQTSKPLEVGFLSPPKNVVVIHDFRRLLPSKKELAHYQYSGPDMGRNNAELTASQGFSDLTNAWHMVINLMPALVPGPSQPRQRLSTRTALAGIQGNSRLTTVSASSRGCLMPEVPTSSFLNSIGVTVARDLFEYFSARADVQMAAALSCALQSILAPATSVKIDRLSPDETNVTEEGDRLQAPLVRQDSVAVTEYSDHSPKKQDAEPANESPRDDLIINPTSLASSLGASGTDPRSSFSTGNTPPSRRISKVGGIRHQRSYQRLKPSPSRIWNFDNASGLIARAGNFASEISRFSLSVSASPPSRKNPSPITGLNSTRSTRNSKSGLPAPNVDKYGRTFSIHNEAFDDTNENKENEKDDGSKRVPARRFKVTYRERPRNARQVSILSAAEQEQLQWLLKAYRSAYAEMLGFWGLPVLRAEVLKHNHSPIQASSRTAGQKPEHRDGKKASLELGRQSRTASNEIVYPEKKEVRTRRLCVQCGHPHWTSSTVPGGAAAPFRCMACQARIRSLVCILCNRMLRGKAFPCPACGHVMHTRCRARMANDPALMGQCPGGCDCQCISQVVVDVKPRSSSSNGKMLGAMSVRPQDSVDSLATEVRIEAPSPTDQTQTQTQPQEQHHRHRSFQDGEVIDSRPIGFAWARESLARNLETRRPRARSVDRRLDKGHDNSSNAVRKRSGIGGIREWT